MLLSHEQKFRSRKKCMLYLRLEREHEFKNSLIFKHIAGFLLLYLDPYNVCTLLLRPSLSPTLHLLIPNNPSL